MIFTYVILTALIPTAKAPVSEPAVSQTCLSPEQMEVSCSSEGDEVQFIWSLDGHLLMQNRTHNQSQRNWKGDTQFSTGTTHKNDRAHISNVSISLYGQLTGNLACHVWNNARRDEKVIRLKSCKDPVYGFFVVTVAVIVSAVTLFLHVALYVGLKHLHEKKITPMTVNEGNSMNDNEIIYSDVKVMKNTRKTRPSSHQNTQ